jgi:hypothetical protein
MSNCKRYDTVPQLCLMPAQQFVLSGLAVTDKFRILLQLTDAEMM